MNYDFDFESLDNVIEVTRKKHNNIFILKEPVYYRIELSFKNNYKLSIMWGLRVFGKNGKPNEIALIGKNDELETYRLNSHPECKTIVNYLNDQQVLDYIKKASELK